MTLTSCIGLVLFAATVSLCQSQPASAVKTDSVEQTASRFLVAFANRDLPAFSEFFAEDATMFFPPSAPGAPSLRVQGKAEIARAFAELYARASDYRRRLAAKFGLKTCWFSSMTVSLS